MSLEKYSETLNSFLELKQLGKGNLLLDLTSTPRELVRCRAQLYLKEGEKDMVLAPH